MLLKVESTRPRARQPDPPESRRKSMSWLKLVELLMSSAVSPSPQAKEQRLHAGSEVLTRPSPWFGRGPGSIPCESLSSYRPTGQAVLWWRFWGSPSAVTLRGRDNLPLSALERLRCLRSRAHGSAFVPEAPMGFRASWPNCARDSSPRWNARRWTATDSALSNMLAEPRSSSWRDGTTCTLLPWAAHPRPASG
jgi:hypothetical protein